MKEQIFGILETVQLNRDSDTYLPYARILLALGLAILGWRLAFTTNFGLGTPIVAWVFLLAIYAYIFMTTLGRRHSFSVQIGSNTMQDTGIFIPGDSYNLLPGRQTTVLQGMGTKPASDASQVVRELGALLFDIRQLGDLGVQKWKQ